MLQGYHCHKDCETCDVSYCILAIDSEAHCTSTSVYIAYHSRCMEWLILLPIQDSVVSAVYCAGSADSGHLFRCPPRSGNVSVSKCLRTLHLLHQAWC